MSVDLFFFLLNIIIYIPSLRGSDAAARCDDNRALLLLLLLLHACWKLRKNCDSEIGPANPFLAWPAIYLCAREDSARRAESIYDTGKVD